MSACEQRQSASEGKSNEATSLRAFSVDPREERAASVKTDGETTAAAKTDLETAPVPALRVPFGAKLLFGSVLGGCIVVLGLSAPKLRAELAAKHAKEAAARVAVAAPAAPPPPVPVALSAPATPPAPARPPLAPDTHAQPTQLTQSVTAPSSAPSENRVAASAPSEPPKATIRLSKKGHTLKVDGKPVKGTSVDVSCGRHLVAVDTEKPHRVEAACGQTLVVDDKKASLHGAQHAHKATPSLNAAAKAKTN